ncbi:TetR/AcrR family transcriptional regulator [Alkalilimnicola ehrlichii MLHE-1]|uniref:Transcriptional regulator, TetR family n=1 Tax=Alkalilimnicola ehrlichii (strain ATCC BAA-1101 / DSM 17681 / MLHE-1) TaxID=187272 RepID=Q0A9S6_ALKEH|nr:TetR/AcrR family transcriptional regulator [Alkalilimnicola ehrlichii]ABI56411.1 transcriptional regulator, TetR family [Alkalilimnicola ehrlichii MLHE-1]
MSDRQRLPAEERKALIIRAVTALCGEHNPARVTMAAIAERMGVTQGALFRHFPSKATIWEAVVDWASGQLLRRADQAIEAADSPTDALEQLFLTHVDFIVHHPGVPRLILGELQHPEPTPARQMAQALLRKYRQRLQTLLQAGCRAGLLRPDLDIEAAATQFIGAIQGLVLQALISGDMRQAATVAPRVFALYLQGIATPHAPKVDPPEARP